MTMTDPIADMFTRIRNASRAKFKKVDMPSSKIKKEIARLLLENKFILNYKTIPNARQDILRVYLRYSSDEEPIIKALRRVSKPGLRIFKSVKEIPRIRNGLGVGIISTSQGVMSDREARRRNLGGEIIAEVW